MNNNKKYGLIFIILSCVILCSCSGERKLNRQGLLLVKNKVHIVNSDSSEVSLSDINAYITPKPNTKFLGMFRLKLWFYEVATLGKKDTKVKKIMKNSLGEPPMIANFQAFDNSKQQIYQQLRNLGYYHSTVSYDIDTTKKRNIVADYTIHTNKPYRYNNISSVINNPEIEKLINQYSSYSLIKKGDRFDAYILDKERERINNILKDNGYYLFLKDYVQYYVDTNQNNYKANVRLEITNPIISVNGENITIDHHKYYINDIIVYPNYDYTIDYNEPEKFGIQEYTYTANNGVYKFYQIGKIRLKHNSIINSLSIAPGEKFSVLNTERTNKGLSTLNILRYSNISFYPVHDLRDSLLNCYIELNRKPVNLASVETEMTNTYGKLGIELNLAYNNRNIFRRGEAFSFKLVGAFEMQVTNRENQPFINTWQYGVVANLLFPRFLAPFRLSGIPRYLYPKTTLEAGYNYQKRTLYTRYLANASFGYNWKQNSNIQYIITPINFNLVKIEASPEFQKILDNLGSTFRSQYTNHIIFGTNMSFIFNNQDRNKYGDFFYFRASIESSGNLLRGINVLFKTRKDEESNSYKIFNVKYAQYILSDFDFKYFHYFRKNNVIVMRFASGIGVPYTNSEALPMEKGFFGGGSNDLRGWTLKSLGPGAYANSLNIERLGDIAIKFNFEYRFPIYKLIRGALFTDAGNIWLLKKDVDFPMGNFDLNRFYREFAVDAGFGIRLDMKNIFVVRLDIGLPIIDPSFPQGKRLRKDYKFSDVVWNFGIGYPF